MNPLRALATAYLAAANHLAPTCPFAELGALPPAHTPEPEENP